MKKETYLANKKAARNEAMEWQTWASEVSMSWGECAYWGDYFTRLGRRYGLLREFHDNGIC